MKAFGGKVKREGENGTPISRRGAGRNLLIIAAMLLFRRILKEKRPRDSACFRRNSCQIPLFMV